MMAGLDLFQFRLHFGTYGQSIFDARLTTRCKAATWGEVDQVRYRAVDYIQLIFDLTENRDRTDQSLSIRMQGFIEQGIDICLLNDLTRIHYRHTFGHFSHHTQIMRNERSEERRVGKECRSG